MSLLWRGQPIAEVRVLEIVLQEPRAFLSRVMHMSYSW